MDSSNWKRILLHWANQTNLLDKVYYNIEQTNVEKFFERFRNKMSTPISATDLVLFMKQQYPECELHLDDENNLSSSDYMYIYSLMLHFSCVKCPEPFFHETCQSLPEQFQQVIASFFKILLERENFSKETLRDAIANSAPKSSLSFMAMESPIRTPRHKISPPTPKTSMLEERTKELNLLRAQLESERYEKGFLEVQLKQNEEKIIKLAQEQKTHLAEIYSLKNELLACNTENYSPNQNCEDEQIKKRLRKDIAEKEETILNMRESLETLREEKVLLREKLNYVEKQVTACLDKIKEMDFQINELKADIEKRDITIRSLTETKNDLELYISESRSLSHRLDVSAECLDISMTRTTNSSSSILSSPENLGVSVVDVQLREKECENSRLLEQIDQMQTDSKKLAEHVCQLIVRYAVAFDICNEHSVLIDEADITHTFMVFENYVEKMVDKYMVSLRDIKVIQEHSCELQRTNTAMANKIADLEIELRACQVQIESLQSEKSSLEERNKTYSLDTEKYRKDIDRLNEIHTEVQMSLQQARQECDTMKQESNQKIHELMAENSRIESLLKKVQYEHEQLMEEKKQIQEDNKTFYQRVDNLLADVAAKNEKLQENEKQHRSMKDTIESHVLEIRDHVERAEEMQCMIAKLEAAIEVLNEEKSQLLDDADKTQLNFESLKSQLDNLHGKYKTQTQVKLEQTNEIEELKTNLQSKEETVRNLVKGNRDLEFKLSEKNQAIEELKNQISEISVSHQNLKSDIEALEIKVSSLNAKLLEKEENLVETQNGFQNYCKEKEFELQSIRDECSQKIRNYESQINDMNLKVETLNEKNTQLHSKITEKDNSLLSLRADFENLLQEKILVENCFESEKRALEDKNNSLQMCTDDLQKELILILKQVSPDDKNATNQNEVTGNPIEALKQKVCELIQSNTELSKSGDKLHSVISDLKDQISDLKKSSFDLSVVCKNLAEENAHSESRVQDLESEKSLLEENITELKNEIIDLKNNECKLQDRLAQSEIDMESLQKKIEVSLLQENKLSNDINTLQNSERVLQQKLEEIQSDVAARIERESNTKKEILNLNRQCLEAREEHSRLVKEIEKSQSTMEESKVEMLSQINKMENEKISLQELINKYANEIAEKEVIEKESLEHVKRIKQLEEIIGEKQTSLEDALQEISSLREKEAILETSQKELEADIRERQFKINELESSVNDKDSHLKSLIEKNTRLERLMREKDVSLDDCHNMISSAEAKYKQVVKTNTEKIACLENQIDVLKSEKKSLEIANNTLQENIDEIENSLKHAQTVNVELLSKIDELKASNAENTERETDYINLQFKHHATCAENEQLLQAKTNLEESCSKLTKRLEKVSLKLGETQATVQKLEKSNNEYRTEMESLQKTYQQTKFRNDELQGKFGTTQKDLKAANEKVNGLQKAYDQEAAHSIALNAELLAFTNKHLEEKASLEDELQLTRNKISELQKRYDEDSAKSQSLNNELKQIRGLLECKDLEIQNQSSFLEEVKFNLQNKLETISKINTEFGEIRSKNDQLQEENARLIEKLENCIALEVELNAARDTIKSLETDKSELTLLLDQHTEAMTKLKESNSHMDGIKNELETKIGQLTEELEEMNASLDSIQKEKARLWDENSTLKRDLENVYEALMNTEVKIEEHSPNDVNSVQHKTTTLLERIKQLNIDVIHNKVVASNLEAACAENSQLSDKLSKYSLKVTMLEEENNNLQKGIHDLESACDELRSEKVRLESKLETRRDEVVYEQTVSQNLLKEQLERCQQQLDEKTRSIALLEHKLENINPELERKDREFASTTEQLQKKLASECELNEKLKKDIAIFQAKLYKNRQITDEMEKQWMDERSKLEEKIRAGDERIKDHRLEMEGKLEKMKNKMKSLYNEEVTKIKSKHEREIIDYKSKVEALLVKNQKYEDHVQKLAKQVFHLNETILELQKQNKFMETRIKDFESVPSSSSLRRHSQFAPQMISSNLRMEDEEGELFNNTYLADLKSGRSSPFGRESVSVSELHYRNSLAPPHLRSTYMAQYPDHHLREEDIKDVPIDLDDSLSSLLHAGQRKKMQGTTSYKKPGPPTPSKNGGRLSFGSAIEPPREILKESNDNSFSNVKKMSTPSKFGRMFSSYKMKDENSPPKRRLSNLFQRKK